MKKKLSIFGLVFATLLIEFPVEGFAGTFGSRPVSISPSEGINMTATANQPRRRRRRRAFRNGRWVWVSYYPNRRYRMARRYYFTNGIRRVRWVRVYY